MQPEIEQAVARVVESARPTLGNDGAIVLYGSGARDEHLPGFSDVNLLVVAERLDPAALGQVGRAFEPLQPWSRTPPLLFTPAEWSRSADVFPIEITDMQGARRVLAGADPVAPLVVQRADLRPALERELRGKLAWLRQGYAANVGSPSDLGRLGARTIATVGVLLRVALVLAREPPSVPSITVFRRAGARIGFDPMVLEQMFTLRDAAEPAVPPGTFAGYLAAVEAAVGFIDQFNVGGD